MSAPEESAGDMGVSSERVGPTGPGQVSTDGVRDTTPVELPADAEIAPGRTAGAPEQNPDGLAPKAGYSSKDPRAD